MAVETEWLADLEEKVRAAVERIDALRQENQALALRVQELEAEHAAGHEPGAGDSATAAAQPAAWRKERAKVKAHVERLTALLEELLAAAEEERP